MTSSGSVGRLSEFKLSEGASWVTYIERMEQYFKVNKVTADMMVAVLIASVGDPTYDLMVDLCSPKKPADVPFSELVELIKQHLEPTPSIVAERYNFRKRVQAANESIAVYTAALKHLARTCDFKAALEENLRDQLVCGIISEPTRQKLFYEGNPSFNKAYKIAATLEAAAQNAAAVEQPRSSGEGTVHALRSARAPVARRTGGPGGAGGSGGGLAGARGAGAQRGEGAGSASRSTREPRKFNSWDKQTCFSCGSDEHTQNRCKFREYVCRICLKEGHLKRMCPRVWRENSDKRRDVYRLDVYGGEEQSASEDQLSDDGYGDGPSGLYHVQLSGSEPVIADIDVHGRQLRMHVDTGSPISCISDVMYGKLYADHKLETNENYLLKGYDGKRIESLGHIRVNVRFGDSVKNLKLFVIRKGGVPLLGREWLKELRMDVIVVNSLESRIKFNKEQFIRKYPTVFSGKLGKLNSECATLRMREGAAPVYRRARPLPLALRPRVDAELQRMEKEGIISPISTSDWASCLVVVLKSNGALRICGDYKSTVNPVLEVDKYPLPRAEHLFNNLSGGKRFTKIDLSEAYSQVCLDESKKYTVVNTHRGLYVYNRLVYGLASAPSIFQRIIERVIAGIPHVSNFLDDILITGDTEEHHLKNLNSVFERLAREGLTIRQEKCTFFAKEVSYLGFIISEQGIRTDSKKIEAVLNAPEPTNVTELKSFIGMINFYSKFIKAFSQIIAPLYKLLKKEVPWSWDKEQKDAFITIKQTMTSCPVLIHYDENLPLVLTCDASGRGVGAVLTHCTGGGERPVAFASRTLTPAEANYSQIQREALAIVYGVKKFHSYLYGRRFTLRTDHQPLTTIFGSKKDLPHTAAGRLIRWAILLSGYQYDIEYVKSESNNADALSRLPLLVQADEKWRNEDEVYIKFVENNFPIQASDVKVETSKDRVTARVLEFVRSGWPASMTSSGPSGDTELAAYWRRRDELYVEGGCLMWGSRVVVPVALRTRVLAEVHGAHMGIVKCKGIARSYVWWPGLDEDIEKMCASYLTCAETADAPPKSVVVPWSWPTEPLERINIDFFTYNSTTYLLVIDGHSKWIEVAYMSTTTAANTISKLKELFARFGVPKKLVSDNGPPFTSDEFDTFLKKNGIKHVTSAPYHPSSNGEAENAVRIVKRALKKADKEKIPHSVFLQRFLMDYRNSKHSTTGETPARLMLGRQIRNRLDLLKNNLLESVTERLRTRADRKEGTERSWKDGDSVWIRDFRAGNKWGRGVVKSRKGSNMYEVETEDGFVWSRHADQLRSRSAAVAPASEAVRAAPTVSARAALADDVSDGELPGSSTENTRNARTRRVPKPVIRYGFDEYV